jgi:hypothetical protein
VIKSRRISWKQYKECSLRDEECVQNLVTISVKKRSLVTHSRRIGDIIKADIDEIKYKDMDWIYLSQTMI